MGSRKPKSDSAADSTTSKKGKAKTKRKRMRTSTSQGEPLFTQVEESAATNESILAEVPNSASEQPPEYQPELTSSETAPEEAKVTVELPPEGTTIGAIVDTLTSEEQVITEAPRPSPILSKISFGEYLIALSSIKGLGRKGLVAIVDAFDGNLERIWESQKEEVYDVLFSAKFSLPEKIADEIVENRYGLLLASKKNFRELTERNIHILPQDKLPASLRDLRDAPRWLFVQGNVQALFHEPAIAVVGTRQPTPQGVKAAGYVAKVISAYPVALVSGLAEGIDEEAHRASLQEGVINVAFLGHGINTIFPAKTAWIREQIVEKGGAVATEYLPHEHYQKSYFVERNRLQAALARIVIPVEANPKGGTAHTIRFAKSLKRNILGIRWKEANGILTDLERDNYPIIDIQSREGWLQLDTIVRKLAEDAGHQTYAFSNVEQRLLNEVKSRNIRPSDLQRLINAIEDVVTEA